jgi:diphthamide synthase subunit DPH2
MQQACPHLVIEEMNITKQMSVQYVGHKSFIQQTAQLATLTQFLAVQILNTTIFEFSP